MLAALAAGDSLVLVDPDHFRDVNEQLGHQGGDQLLTDFAILPGVRLDRSHPDR